MPKKELNEKNLHNFAVREWNRSFTSGVGFEKYERGVQDCIRRLLFEFGDTEFHKTLKFSDDRKNLPEKP